MSNQLRFEGNDLESLLERVRAEAGADARIIAANKLRKGGVGGFFARELFEVIVEPSLHESHEAELRPAARLGRARRNMATIGGVGAATSVLDLADEVEAIDAIPTIDSKLEHTIDLRREERTHGDLPEVSTQTERFAEILERLANTNSEVARDVGLEASPDQTQIVHPITASTAGAVEPMLYRRANAAGNAHTRTDVTAQPQLVEPARSIAPANLADHDELIERPETALARLGVPARYVPRGMHTSSLRGALIDSFTRLPSAESLPPARGVTVAIVGLGARPVALARILAAEQGIDPDTVVIATERELGNGVPTWLQITDELSAQERRRSWRRRDHVSFVAVSVASLTAASEWTNTMLDHLEPTQIWAVANAGWKAEDVSAWAQRLGGFDVLAVERLDETVSPASLLEVGVPIVRLDGEPASPNRWAEILLDRMVVS